MKVLLIIISPFCQGAGVSGTRLAFFHGDNSFIEDEADILPSRRYGRLIASQTLNDQVTTHWHDVADLPFAIENRVGERKILLGIDNIEGRNHWDDCAVMGAMGNGQNFRFEISTC